MNWINQNNKNKHLIWAKQTEQNKQNKIIKARKLTFDSCLELLILSFLWFDSPFWLGVEVAKGKGEDVALCNCDDDERCLCSFLVLLISLRSIGPESRLLWFFSTLLDLSLALSWFLPLESFSFLVRLLCSCLFEWFWNNHINKQLKKIIITRK